MTVLLVTDTEADARDVRTALEGTGAQVTVAPHATGAFASLDAASLDAGVVVGSAVPAVCAQVDALRQHAPALALIVVSPPDAHDVAIAALGRGADEWVPRTDAFPVALAEALRRSSSHTASDDRLRAAERSRRRTEIELEQARAQIASLSARAVEAQRASGLVALVRGVCHEINNPLTGILGYAQLLQEGAEGRLLEDLQEIEICAKRCRDLSNLLARFCRADDGPLAAVDLNALVTDALLFMEYPFKRSRVRLATALQEDLPAVHGNATRLRLAVLAILTNAAQAIEAARGGALEVRSHVEIGRVHLTVTDSGAGIAEAHLERIFEPFFSTRDSSESSGMGLSVARAIVEEHGGHIVVDRPVAGGTRVSFVLPTPVAASPSPASTEAAATV